MNKKFHEDIFDDATQLKLQIFRKYIRKWLPTFMTRYEGRRRNFGKIRIYDFFSGPGYDADKNPGSPTIIVEEIKAYCKENEKLKAENVEVQMFFNDIKSENISKLKSNIEEARCSQQCCKINYSSLPFQKAFEEAFPIIHSGGAANLIIMDQFGVTDITPEIIKKLSDCRFTDILFFISSSYIYRFKDVLGLKLGIKYDEMKNIEYNTIHCFICDYFREKLGTNNYYLSPFSIRKNKNIYGVIFGSGNLLGLEKFLQACWEIDTVTGQSNYNIDKDFAWNGERSLFEDDNLITKIDLFEKDLIDYIKGYKPNNCQLNEFCLKKGFCSKKAFESLDKLQKNAKIRAVKIETNKPARKRAFYLINNSPKVNFYEAVK